MKQTIHAYAATKPTGQLTPFEYEAPALGAHDLLIKITHCGICHSDLHLLNDDWKMTTYPFVPGHEIVGQIIEIGSDVSCLKKGMRIGVGWQRGSCHTCEWCRTGEENLCENIVATCVGHHGGFADHIVVDSRFAVVIPDGLDSAHAAPLLCGGGTTFTPFFTHGVNGSSKVAVIGVGGLGHLGIQFARHLEADVTAISSNPSKKEEALGFGADRFIDSIEEIPSRQFDFILNTSPGKLDFNSLLTLLRPKGVLCQVGVPSDPITVEAHSLIAGSKMMSGSAIISPIGLDKMLDFAVRHRIEPLIETFPIHQVNDAMKRIKERKVRYRAVLCMETS